MNFQTESNDNFLIIVLGDHGMAAEGGHGGSTYLETHVPVVGLSNSENFSASSKNTVIEQVDLASTISSFLGVDIPSNSLGINFLTEVFEEKGNEEFLVFSLMKNGNQLKNIIKKSVNKLDSKLIGKAIK